MGENSEIGGELERMRITSYQRAKVERLIKRAVGETRDAERQALGAIATLTTEVLEEAMLASEMKSQFLASMSHELRSPLHAIIGFVELILFRTETTIDPEIKLYLETMLKSAKGLMGIINNLLDLSKIEAGRMELVITEVSIGGLAESLYREYVLLAEKKGIELKYFIDEKMPQVVRSDKQMLRSIAINLLGNAIKFTEAGSVELAFLRSSEGWQMRVVDTGIGFDMTRDKELWEPFMQLEGGSSRKYGGTGLGLALVQRMTKLLGGEVKVESEVGKGSTFTVTLPTL